MLKGSTRFNEMLNVRTGDLPLKSSALDCANNKQQSQPQYRFSKEILLNCMQKKNVNDVTIITKYFQKFNQTTCLGEF